MKVKMVSIGSVEPYDKNPRNNAEAVDLVAASIQEFGWKQPLVVDDDNVIIVGHTRYLAAKKLGMDKVPVVVADDLTPDQVRAYRIADNRTGEEATWNNELLKAELEALQNEDFDLALTGFNTTEIEQILLQHLKTLPPAADPDDAPELLEDPETVLGDVYEIGPHRLYCGDSTLLDDVSNLMDGDKADAVFTDPPYGMSYGGGRARGEHSKNKKGGVVVKAHGEIIGDDKRGDELIALVRDSLSSASANAKAEIPFYVCFPWRTYTEFLQGLEEAGLSVSGCIVWDKGSIGLGTAHYRPQHEFIFYCKGANWYGGLDQSDVWSFTRGNTGDYVHPTQKPVALVEKAIENSTQRGNIVLDVFGGSGSTMVACQQTNRVARLMELDPKFCDAIVNRMHKLWPDMPIKRNGKLLKF